MIYLLKCNRKMCFPLLCLVLLRVSYWRLQIHFIRAVGNFLQIRFTESGDDENGLVTDFFAQIYKGGLWVFPIIKITLARQVHMWPASSVCFCVCGQQKPEDPQLKPHGWRCHYTGWYTRSGIPLVYLWFFANF